MGNHKQIAKETQLKGKKEGKTSNSKRSLGRPQGKTNREWEMFSRLALGGRSESGNRGERAAIKDNGACIIKTQIV